MEDVDGLKFYFEDSLDSKPIQPTASVPVAPPEKSSSAAVNIAPSYDNPSATVAGARRGRSYRQTVCRHWLRGNTVNVEKQQQQQQQPQQSQHQVSQTQIQNPAN